MDAKTKRAIRRIGSKIIYPIAAPVMELNYRMKGIIIESDGIENVPRQGPCVIVSRHQDYSDAALLGLALRRELSILPGWIMGDFSGNALMKFVLPMAGAIKVYRPGIDLKGRERNAKKESIEYSRKSLDDIAYGLGRGDHFVLFGEGNFHIGEIGHMKPGVFKIAREYEENSGIKVAFSPVGFRYNYEGYDEDNYPPTRNVHLSKLMEGEGRKLHGITFRFGKPIYRENEELSGFSERVRIEIEKLSGLGK